LGFSEVEVNAFTGHSNNSHTAVTHYFHLDGNRAGRRIVEEALKGVPEKAGAVIEEDNRVQRLEEGEELVIALEAGAAAVGAAELVRFDWTGTQSEGGGHGLTGGLSSGTTTDTRRGMAETGGRDLRERVMKGLGRGAQTGSGPQVDGRSREEDPARIGLGKPGAPSDCDKKKGHGRGCYSGWVRGV
jgi:hypothetical protein